MSSQTNNKRSRSIVMKEIACFLGFLLCFASIGLIVVNSCELLALHASGYTAEATVTENLRKSRARVQFTDYSGVSQTATISRTFRAGEDNILSAHGMAAARTSAWARRRICPSGSGCLLKCSSRARICIFPQAERFPK